MIVMAGGRAGQREGGRKGGRLEGRDGGTRGWRAGAHALHLGHDLLVRLLERQVVAAAAVVHRMPLVLHHLYQAGWAVMAWH